MRALAAGSCLDRTGGWVHPQDGGAKESGGNAGGVAVLFMKRETPSK